MAVDDHGLEAIRKAAIQKRLNDKSEYVIEVQSDTSKHTITETVSSSLTFVGETFTLNDDGTPPDESSGIWRIKRILTQGDTVTEGFAGSGEYDQVLDDRASLFPTPVFTNTLSVLLDGVNDHLDGGDIFQFDIANAFSISMWVKPDNIAGNRILFSKAGPAPAVDGYMLRHNATTGALFLQMRTTTIDRSHTFDKSLTASVWQNVVFTYSGASNINGAHVYVDGSKSSTPPSGSLGGTMLGGFDFLFGQRTNTFYFTGNFDQMAVFDKELSQAEVDEIYNSGAPADVLEHSAESNLVSYYTIDDDSGIFPTISDQKGSNNLTCINMVDADTNFVADVP